MIEFNKLKEEQLKLAKKVITTDSFEKITSIAGTDQLYVKDKVISAVVVCDYKTLKVIEKKHAIAEAKIPYKSSFLFYKDGPAAMEAFNKLENKPDIIILEANGILHPRRIGMASHVGILLDTATIGVTKRLMLGQVRDNTKDSGQGNPDFLAKMVDYNSEEKKPMDMVKSALKNLYSTFVSYTKSTYSAVTSSANKIVEGPVKITMLKLIRVFEYVLTALNPQWNRVPGSPQDLDTLAPAITNHIITDKENLKYNSGYGALMYWHK